MKRLLIIIFIIAFMTLIVLQTVYLENYHTFSRLPTTSCKNKADNNYLNTIKERKYITCSVYEAGGFGNQIWRFASIYGLARFTGRIPYFEIIQFQTAFTNTTLKLTNLSEIAYIFPLMHEMLEIKHSPKEFTKSVNFAEDCCSYEDPKTLLEYSEKFLKIQGNYMHSYKFFHSYRPEIQELFECGPSISVKVKQFSNKLFNNDSSFKLCTHIRRGDFIKDSLLESRAEFVVPSISYAYKYITKRRKNAISLVFLGNDLPFIKNIKLENVSFHQIYIPELQTRGEDMCFGINYCDAMIMTASGSTFAWWMSYLMKSKGPVFHNSQVSESGKESKDIHDFHLFLPEWIMLTLKNGKIIEETQWWHEKFGLNFSEPKISFSNKTL